MDAAVAKWTASADARDAVTRVADALGENPMSMIEDMAKRGTAEQDFTRLKERLAQSDTPKPALFWQRSTTAGLLPEILQDTIKAIFKWRRTLSPRTMDGANTGRHSEALRYLGGRPFQAGRRSQENIIQNVGSIEVGTVCTSFGREPRLHDKQRVTYDGDAGNVGRVGYMTPTAIDTFLTRMGFSPEAGLCQTV